MILKSKKLYLYPIKIIAAAVTAIAGLSVFLFQPATVCYQPSGQTMGIPVLDIDAPPPSSRDFLLAAGILCFALLCILWHHNIRNKQNVKLSTLETQSMMDKLPVGIQCCKMDSLFTITYSNDSFLKMVGYTREEIKMHFNNKFLMLVHEDDRDRVAKEAQCQLARDGRLAVQYRLVKKGGVPLWVFDSSLKSTGSDGEDHIYCVLTDITQEKRASAKVGVLEQSYRTALRAAYDMIFESDIKTDSFVTRGDEWMKIYATKPSCYSNAVSQHYSICHPEDADAFWRFCRIEYIKKQASKGKKMISLEYRILQPSGEYSWLSCSIVPIFDINGQLEKLIGCLQRIDERKNKEQKLLLSAQTDSLTGFYNKRATQKLIIDYLKDEGRDSRHAMLLLDIDNFKSVNDSFGHMFGDEVISNISARIKKVFRSSDIIGRIGGDEFMILIKNIHNDDLVQRKACAVCDMLHGVCTGEDSDYKISGSIGISFYPTDGLTFWDLYQKTDRALYSAKRKGKDTIAYFSEETDILSGLHAGAAESRNSENDAGADELGSNLDGRVSNFAWHVFESLHDALDQPSAIYSILEMAGRLFAVSRVYICQATADRQRFTVTYEWCDRGVSPQKEWPPQANPPCTVDEYLEHFNEDGVLYCADTAKLTQPLNGGLEARGIKSILQYAVMQKGKLLGIIGFDQCSVTRVWMKEEIDALSAISKIISVFLYNKAGG